MVIDSSAFVAMHFKEPGHERIFEKIAAAPIAVMGSSTLLECAIVMTNRRKHDTSAAIQTSLRQLRVQILPFNEDHYYAALSAFLRFGKGRHPAALNFGDCMSYAVAAVSGFPLLYTGTDFAQTDIRAA